MLQFKSHNGMTLDALAFGTFQIPPGEETYRAVSLALEVGYTSIDTAKYYNNEQDVAKAVRKSGKKIQITTKVWNDEQGYDLALAAGRRSRDYLQVDCIDLLLVHWPGHGDKKMIETWHAFHTLQEEGTVKYIGVSNFSKTNIETLIKAGYSLPSSNQFEVNPLFTQVELREYCNKQNIIVEGWRPLMFGDMSHLAPIENIAKKYHKTLAQIAIRWAIQSKIRVLAKSVHIDRIKENFDVFDFELTKDEILTIDKMNINKRTGPVPDQFVF